MLSIIVYFEDSTSKLNNGKETVSQEIWKRNWESLCIFSVSRTWVILVIWILCLFTQYIPENVFICFVLHFAIIIGPFTDRRISRLLPLISNLSLANKSLLWHSNWYWKSFTITVDYCLAIGTYCTIIFPYHISQLYFLSEISEPANDPRDHIVSQI